MKALVKVQHGDGFIELKEVPRPHIGPDDVLINVKAVGICGFDITLYHETPAYSKFLNPPVILGHEFSGVIVEVGKNVKDFTEGDRVTCETHAVTCGRCYYCMSGKYNLCPERLGLGYQKDGAFAEFVKVPVIRLHKLPNNISFEEGALSEPCSVCYHALVDIAHIKPGESVVIIGPGPIGLLSLQIAKIQGARIILVSGTELDKERLSLANKLGAEVTVNISEEDPVKKVMEITNRFGCDIVIETSGAALARMQAIDMVRKGGKIVLIGHGAGKAEVNLDPLVYKEVAMLGSWSHVWEDWENVLKLMATNYINVKPLINKFPLNEWKKAFEAVEMKKVVKAILIP